jgi:hypothetical protein
MTLEVKFQRVSNNEHVWYEWHLPQHGYNVGGVSFRMATMTSSSSSSPVLGVKVKTVVKLNSKCGSGTGQGLFASVAMTTGQEVARMATPQREKSRTNATIEKRIPWGGFIIDGTDFIFDVEDESHSRQLWSYIQHSPNPNVKVTIQEDGAVFWVYHV